MMETNEAEEQQVPYLNDNTYLTTITTTIPSMPWSWQPEPMSLLQRRAIEPRTAETECCVVDPWME
jgi:hypothetical protein